MRSTMERQRRVGQRQVGAATYRRSGGQKGAEGQRGYGAHAGRWRREWERMGCGGRCCASERAKDDNDGGIGDRGQARRSIRGSNPEAV